MCANFQAKQATLIFLAQFAQKMDLQLEIQETNVGIRISIFEIQYVQIFRQNGKLWFFMAQIFLKMNFRVGISKM